MVGVIDRYKADLVMDHSQNLISYLVAGAGAGAGAILTTSNALFYI